MARKNKPRKCTRKGCESTCYGQQQVCDACKAQDKICNVPGCGKPKHGDKPTTKQCLDCQRAHKGRRKDGMLRNPRFTPDDDQKIRDIYTRFNNRQLGVELTKLFPTRARWAVQRRAQILGAVTSRVKEPAWSEEEVAILRECSWMSHERIQMKLRAQGFKRTLTAVSIKLKRIGRPKEIGVFDAQTLAGLMGVDLHKVIEQWVGGGQLVADRRGNDGRALDRYAIRTEDLRAFLLAHPESYTLSNLERSGSKMWFLSLITSGRIAEEGEATPVAAAAPAATTVRHLALFGEKVTAAALADISGRSEAVLLHRIDELGMGVEEAAFGALERPAAARLAGSTAMAAAGLLKLMKKHRSSPEDVARWIGAPAAMVSAMLAGTVPLVLPALEKAVAQLDGKITVTIAPNTWSWER